MDSYFGSLRFTFVFFCHMLLLHTLKYYLIHYIKKNDVEKISKITRLKSDMRGVYLLNNTALAHTAKYIHDLLLENEIQANGRSFLFIRKITMGLFSIT